jgi:hypothetical protein
MEPYFMAVFFLEDKLTNTTHKQNGAYSFTNRKGTLMIVLF